MHWQEKLDGVMDKYPEGKAKLARRCGISDDTLYTWTGKGNKSIDALVAIIRETGCDANWLLDETCRGAPPQTLYTASKNIEFLEAIRDGFDIAVQKMKEDQS